MDRNSLLQSTFEIVIWPEIQDYMTIDNFRENAILIADLQLGIFKVRILNNPVGLISLAGLEQSLKCIEYQCRR